MEKVSFMFSELSENDLQNIYGGEFEEKMLSSIERMKMIGAIA